MWVSTRFSRRRGTVGTMKTSNLKTSAFLSSQVGRYDCCTHSRPTSRDVIYVAITVTVTTLVILAAGSEREYPDGESTGEARLIKVAHRTVFVHSLTGSSTYIAIGDE